MYGMQFGLALAAVAGFSEELVFHPPVTDREQVVVLVVQDDSLRRSAPEPWLQADPADSVYRAAREALNRRDFSTAATLFAQISSRFPKSGYAADALYWQAFALYRAGGDRDLHSALAALRQQRGRFPKAATQGDAAALERRVPGEAGPPGRPGSCSSSVRGGPPCRRGPGTDANLSDATRLRRRHQRRPRHGHRLLPHPPQAPARAARKRMMT